MPDLWRFADQDSRNLFPVKYMGFEHYLAFRQGSVRDTFLQMQYFINRALELVLEHGKDHPNQKILIAGHQATTLNATHHFDPRQQTITKLNQLSPAAIERRGLAASHHVPNTPIAPRGSGSSGPLTLTSDIALLAEMEAENEAARHETGWHAGLGPMSFGHPLFRPSAPRGFAARAAIWR